MEPDGPPGGAPAAPSPWGVPIVEASYAWPHRDPPFVQSGDTNWVRLPSAPSPGFAIPGNDHAEVPVLGPCAGRAVIGVACGRIGDWEAARARASAAATRAALVSDLERARSTAARLI